MKPKAPDNAALSDPARLAIIYAGEEGFRSALARASARGGPAREIDALCAATGEGPRLLNGQRMTRMSLGIQRLMQKRAAMPGTMDSLELLLFFSSGPAVFALFEHYSEEDQAWQHDGARRAYEEMLAETDTMVNDRIVEPVRAWMSRELNTFGRLAHDDDTPHQKTDQRAVSTEGSRVGWWLRALEAITVQYAALCPAGLSVASWAVWDFPINDYLALQPAALERSGIELAEHYAVREGREGRKTAKEKAEALLQAPREASAEPPRAEAAPAAETPAESTVATSKPGGSRKD